MKNTLEIADVRQQRRLLSKHIGKLLQSGAPCQRCQRQPATHYRSMAADGERAVCDECFTQVEADRRIRQQREFRAAMRQRAR